MRFGISPVNRADLPPRRTSVEEAFSIAERLHSDERLCQRCRVGLRRLAMISGVSRTHHGPCGTLWMPSSFPDLHHGERLALAPVIGLMFLVGLLPQLILDSVNPTVVNLLAHWRF